MLEIFLLPFMGRALLALLATGAAFPVLGTFILNLELIPARFAVMHAALLGAAIGLVAGLAPMAAATAASLLVGVGIAGMSWKKKVSAGGSLGLVMTVSLGGAFIIFYKGNVHAIEAFNLFWGNVLALTTLDTAVVIVCAAAILLFLAFAFKEIHIVLYDRELAAAVGVKARGLYFFIMVSVCLGIAVAMRVTGALLVDAVTILPALAARSLGRTFRGTVLWGIVCGLLMNLGGFALSFLLDLPVSPAIIMTGAFIIGAAGLAKKIKRRGA